MVVLKCPSCGATLPEIKRRGVCVCEYCGTEVTAAFPKSRQAIDAMVARNSSGILRRAFLFLEDRDWGKADEYAERGLDDTPEEALLYLVKLLARAKASSLDELVETDDSVLLHSLPEYDKLLRFAEPELKQLAEEADQAITLRLDEKTRPAVEALRQSLSEAKDLDAFDSACRPLLKLPDVPCVQQMTEDKKQLRTRLVKKEYGRAIELMKAYEYGKAAGILEKLDGYGSSRELLEKCRKYDAQTAHYRRANSLRSSKKWRAAAEEYAACGNFQDSVSLARKCSKRAKQYRDSDGDISLGHAALNILSSVWFSGLLSGAVMRLGITGIFGIAVFLVMTALTVEKNSYRSSSNSFKYWVICMIVFILISAICKSCGFSDEFSIAAIPSALAFLIW